MKTLHRQSHRLTKLFLISLIFLIIVGTVLYVVSTIRSASQTLSETTQQSQSFTALSVANFQKEAKKKMPVYIQLPNAAQIRAIVENYTRDDSLWVLVSKKHSIPITYVPVSLVLPNVTERADKSTEERSVRADMAKPLKALFDAAQVDGHTLMVGSAYRSSALQKFYFDSYSAVSGIAAANKLSAYPGQSEHQTGLAVDIGSVSKSCYLNACFTSTPDGQWLATHAYKYGFTLRYPQDKTAITGYDFEPWHYRYVGIDLATALYQSKLTLDEAWLYLQTALTTLQSNGAL